MTKSRSHGVRTQTPPAPTLAARVRAMRPEWSWNQAREFVGTGRVTVDGAVVKDASQRVSEAATVALHDDKPRERKGVLPTERILHVDDEIVVLNKPPHVNTVSFHHKGPERERDTLVELVRARLRRMFETGDNELGVVQRLDRETTGVMVMARTLTAKASLETQIRAHTVTREYEALVHGTPHCGTFQSWIVQDRGDGLRGSGHERDSQAQFAHTDVVEVVQLQPGVSWVRCQIHTGRQHQIRIHLAEAGHPLLGERVYIRDFRRNGGKALEAPRVMLHARLLEFVHPRTGERVKFTAPADDFADRYGSAAV